MDDQIDSKTLYGNYICSDTPGEFIWQHGALTQAISQGRWVIIEHIDRASFDIVSSLIHLLETKTLLIPGRNEIIKAHPNFQFIATSQITRFHNYSNSNANKNNSIHVIFNLLTHVKMPKLNIGLSLFIFLFYFFVFF